jgi:hypothetical protein
MIYRTRLFGSVESFVCALIAAGLFVHFSNASFENVIAVVMAITAVGFVYLGVSSYKDKNEDLRSEIRIEREYTAQEDTKRELNDRIASLEREFNRLANKN